MTIGERVLELIRKCGMTQKDFSQRTGIAQSTISEWGGKRINPGSDRLMIICDVLGVDPYYPGTMGRGSCKAGDLVSDQ